ncbi:cohesin loading factor-domain-containing protein [Boeremia exigua]|uniref:cohesin loading factor-domain-containing protein n=1 Tax=Boeremia exigua TaxID=749465 RepID=UPI001E8DBC6D|nr:cohesin loading factor-domain-containing protein [Boeremia exigua]KAH6642580.1 cohesin loading factor-domain-containing protein [Boeremia exigua]
MDPRYNQQYGYPNRPNAQYPPQQSQNGYQQYGQAPQHPQQYQQYPPAQNRMHHGYQPQPQQPQVVISRPQSQQFMTMPQHQQTYPPQQQQMYPPQQQQTYSPQQQYQQRAYQHSQYQQMPQQQLQYQQSPQQPQQRQPQQRQPQPQQQQQQQQQRQHQQPQQYHQVHPSQPRPQPSPQPQPQARAQPQVMIPQRSPSSMPYHQMSSPRTSSPSIRQVQVPIQRIGNGGISQMDGSQDMYRRQSAQQVPTPPVSRPVQRPISHQENIQRPPQRPPSTPVQNQTLQQQQRPPGNHIMSNIEQQQRHQQRASISQTQMSIEPQTRSVPQVQITPQRTLPQAYQQPSRPIQTTPTQRTPSHQAPSQQPRPVQVTPTQRTPSQQTPLQQPRPVSTTPTQQTPSRDAPSQQSSSQPRSHPKVVIPRPASHQLTSPTKSAHPQLPHKAAPVDLSIMLLSTADEYIAAARSIGPTIARQKRNIDIRQYYKLMSTAMGCMDAVLRKFNLQPREEAKLRLRYASLLIEETDNTTEIDAILSKGISLCARCRLQDLRYSMLHLQARYQYQTNHRAALKAVDKNISEAETFQQIAWVYAFRFLKISLLLQSTDRVEAIPALQQLHAINAYAEKRGDTAVAFTCHALEAMVHLRSSAQDRLIEAQRAIAQARSLQLTMSAKQQGSFGTLFSVIDLACSVHQNAPDSAKSTSLIQATADENDDGLGTESGVFTVTLDRTSGGNLTTDTGGIFRRNVDGRDELVFTWLPREDIKALCFLICALDQSMHEKSLQLVQEARSRTRDSMRRQSSFCLPISTACAQTQWRKVLDWHATFTLGLIAAHREEYTTATDALSSLTKRITSAPYVNQQDYTQSLSYLEAIIDQTNGRFDAAHAIYTSGVLVLTDKNSVPTLTSELAILAAMNRLLIARDPANSDHENVGALLSKLRLACEEHPSQYVRMAFTLVNALCTLDPSINRLKTLMNNATQKSHDLFKRTHNREFVVMSLCYFTARFFIEPVTDKSSSAANAVRQHAKHSNRPLWMAVACGLMIKVFEHHNSVAEKQKYEEVYEKVRVKLPAPLRGDDVDAEGEDDDGDIMLVG